MRGHNGLQLLSVEVCEDLVCQGGDCHKLKGNRDLHSDVWGAGVALLFFRYCFLNSSRRCLCPFFPALGNTSQLVVFLPKLS